MTQHTYNNISLVGHFSVDSGQAMVGDPCYLDEWNTNKDEEWNLEGKENHYSYQGASATTIKNDVGILGDGNSVVFSTGYGDGTYPVYVHYNEDGRVMMALIDMSGEEPVTAIDVTREYTIGGDE
jgi:hypothetical protein